MSERVRGALQLFGGRAVCGRIVQNVLRRVVLLRVNRAAQSEPGPVIQRDVFHVLRAVAQDRRSGGRRTDTSVPGRHPGRGAACRPPRPVQGSPVRHARLPGRVRFDVAVIHDIGSADRGDRILVQRHGPNGHLHIGVRAILRASLRV